MLQVYNTKTRQKETFKQIKQDCVRVYSCGPTVYNYAHIWNLRTFVFEDMVIRSLKFLWYNLRTVMNITDVDDKTIRDSIKAGETLKAFTEKYTDEFKQDMKKLSMLDYDELVPVTTLIPEMVRMIQTMLNRKNAYLADDGSVYFKVASFKNYGKLAHLDMKNMKSTGRVDNDEYDKENIADFALWKVWSEEDGDNFWEQTFTIEWKEVVLKWRPGWHIECSACNMKTHGKQIDIHMWGVDLIFPHHQNEIAQTESCTGKEFSKYWLHSGHLMVDGKKMSKSLGNFYTLRDIEKKFSDIESGLLMRSIRLSFLGGKYSDSIDFSFAKLEASINTIKRTDEMIKSIARAWETSPEKWVGRDFREYMQELIGVYIERLEDDFSIPDALAVFFEFQKFINTGISEQAFSKEEIYSIVDMLRSMNEVFAFIDLDILDAAPEEVPSDIAEKLEARNTAKADKDFELADALRDEITAGWYKIIDDREGTRVEKI